MRGSAVLFNVNGRYQRGFVGEYIYGNLLEVFLPGKPTTIMKTSGELILDEKPNVHELAIGILVLGEDATSLGQIREGKIEQISNLDCTIKSNDEIWMSDLNNIRIVKRSGYCSQY